MIVYAKSSTTRKKEYRLITTIEKENGKLFVRKRAENEEAKSFLFSMIEKYKKLKVSSGSLIISQARIDGDSLIFSFQEGKVFLEDLESKLIKKDVEAVAQGLKKFKEVLKSLPSEVTNPNEKAGFKEVFGTSLTGEVECLSSGCLDFNLDNLIINKDQVSLIDYEWVFDFPIPVEFLYFRSLFYIFSASKDSIEYNVSSSSPAVMVTNKCWIPKTIFDAEFPRAKKIKNYLEMEGQFQSFISGRKVRIKFLGREITKVPMDKDLIQKSFYLESLVEEQRKRLETQDLALDEMRKVLQNIYSSKRWKVAQAISKASKVMTPKSK